MACPLPLENARNDATSHAGNAFNEYALRRTEAQMQPALFDWADRSPALRCLRYATYEASVEALRESRSYLSDDEYANLARNILTPFISEFVTRCVTEALNSVLKEAVKSVRG